MFGKISCFSMALGDISEFEGTLYIDFITSKLFLIFPEISGNIKFPEILQP